jgi:hypothetical protein
MRLPRNEYCPVHKSLSCCGRELQANKPRLIRLGVQRIDDPHHPRGYRELRSPAEMRKPLNRKIVSCEPKTTISMARKVSKIIARSDSRRATDKRPCTTPLRCRTLGELPA